MTDWLLKVHSNLSRKGIFQQKAGTLWSDSQSSDLERVLLSSAAYGRSLCFSQGTQPRDFL